jgi:hypothetical protein
MYFISSADANAFYVGDPVTLSGNGDTTRGIPGVTVITPGTTPLLGAILAIGVNPDGGPYIDPNNLTLVNAPATKTQNYYVLVADDPLIIFEVEEGTAAGAAGTPFTSAEIGLNANMVLVAPATGVKTSGALINNATEATTATLDLKILGLARRLDNAFGARAKWNVLINSHVFRAGIAGL